MKSKKAIFLLFISINLYSQQKDSAEFSDIFKTYSEKYQTVVVQYPGGFWGQKWTHYRIIYKQKWHWFLADYFVSPIKLFNDSVVINKCYNCAEVFKQLLLKERELKSENEITTRCRKLTPVVNRNGDSAISERNLDTETHVGTQILEYRIKKKKGTVWQRTPEVALEICPESIERRIFFDLLHAIKYAH